MKRKRTTIEDVAALAGVSRQTVSRVLNNPDSVADETRARVLAVIEKLNYRPSASARSLASRRTFILGILTADLSDYTHARIIEGTEAEARKHGYMTFVSGAEGSPLGEPLHSSLLSQHRAEGLFIVYHGADCDNHAIFEDIPNGLPVVSIGYARHRENVTTLGIANYGGARQATAHLLSLGHRRIAHITGSPEMYESQERQLGYAEALQEAGVAPDGTLTAAGDWSSASGYGATLELVDHDSGFTALFAQNDRMAMGAIRALHERGLRVPEDVAVVGFDDIPAAPYFCPSLTTVHHPFYKVGQAGARLLIDLINGQPVRSNPICLETKLVIRQSCGAQGSAG